MRLKKSSRTHLDCLSAYKKFRPLRGTEFFVEQGGQASSAMALAAAMAFSWAAGGAVHFPARSIRAGPPPGRVNLLGRSESALREFSAALRIRGAEAPGAVRAQLGLPPMQQQRPVQTDGPL